MRVPHLHALSFERHSDEMVSSISANIAVAECIRLLSAVLSTPPLDRNVD
jgi:hypothetical protein